MLSSILSKAASFRLGWGSALTLSVLISAFLMLCMEKFAWYVVLAAALFFFGLSIIILVGDVGKRLIYCIFLIQFSASFYVPFSFYITLVCIMFLPPIILISKNIDKLNGIPCHKSMALLFSGWLIALVYSNVINPGHKYFLLFDIYFILGFGIAYSVFFLLRLEHLDTDRMIRYITLSCLFFVGMVLAKYIAKGYASHIFGGRFGMRVNINPNLVAFYLNMTLSCAFFTALFEKRRIAKKIFLYSMSAILLGVILATGSRGAILGIGAMMIYFLWHKRSILWILGTVAGIGTVIAMLGPKYMVRMLAPSTLEIISDMGRLELLKAAYKVLKDNYFFFGIGMNSFSLLKMEYGIPVWFPSPEPAQNLSSHNTYTDIWLGWGLLGLIGWLTFNIGIIYALLRYNEEKHNGAAKATAFALLSFLLYGFVDCNIGNFSLMFTYFSIAGIAMYIITQAQTGAKLPSA